MVNSLNSDSDFDGQGGLVPGTPESIFYFPDFFSSQEEEEILSKIYQAPKPKWVSLKDRKLQNWGGLPSSKTGKMISETLPCWLETVSAKIYNHIFKPKADLKSQLSYLPRLFENFNHVLINEYLPGQGIFAHEDGPFYFPLVATVTLGSHAVINYRPKADQNTYSKDVSLFLEPRSLVIMTNDLYKHFTHSIEPVTTDYIEDASLIANALYCQKVVECAHHQRKTRVSLTFRHVKNVVKPSSRLFGLLGTK